ncbi:DUF192 domain-containing protein [Caldimonas aquatica]|uniref:DUF192 domain-containing protein n=1 Tax=Caldimonas aquatica TaxID=376175 RepID=UPI003CC91606
MTHIKTASHRPLRFSCTSSRTAFGALRRSAVPGFGGLIAASFALFFPATSLAQGQPQQLPSVALQAGIHVIRAEVARTPEQRQTGLMFRKELAPNDAMLFVFELPAQQCFWMKNTLIPLSIAFLRDDGTIVNIADMKPQTLDSHCSAEPVRFALEMNQGWFAKRGLKPGAKIKGEPFGNR